VASGERLSFSQDDIVHRGHSIECRINAEDPARRFLPTPGTLTRLRVPGGPGVRWDGGYTEGDTISQFYDNLLGKLVVWAETRPAAIERMVRALRELEVEGVHTTVSAHLPLLQHPDFAAARHSTKWVEDEVDHAQFAPVEVRPPEEGDDALAARTVPVEVDGKRFTVKVWLPDRPSLAQPSTRAKPRPARAATGGPGGDGTITAPMQGTIVKVLVEVGSTVEVGQAVLVLEAMKMENHVNAERTGTVREIRVAAGDAVGTGDVLAVID
jgi:acetyl-CoA/propionyl-CoA carboxylase biotin carboxyl carrier protein